jgi:hypothetical protein
MAALLVGMLGACYKDLGNYDYEDPNKVIFGGIKEYYAAMQGDYFEIIPQLSFTDPAAGDSARYKYEWISMKIGALLADKRKDLGKNKGLRIKMNLTTGKYKIYYRILDTLTGIQWQKSFDLEVMSNIYEGWMLMTEVNGKARLDMINKLNNQNNQYTVMPDVLASTGSGLELQGKPVAVHCFRMTQAANGYAIFLSTDKTTERIDAETFQYKSTMNIKYEMVSNVPDNFAPQSFAPASSGIVYMVEGANAYYYESVFNIRWGLPINVLKGQASTFRIAPFLAPNASIAANMTAMYDMDNRRFVRHVGSEASLSLMPTIDTLFNYNTGKDLTYMTYTPFGNGNVFAILQELDKSKYYLARFTLGTNTRQVDYDEMTATDINKASFFAVSPDYGYIFYTVGGKLYSYDISAMASKLMIDKGNKVFTQLRFRNSDLVAASVDPGLPEGSNGTLEVFSVQPVQGPLVLQNSWSGVGKIVSFSYRVR